MKKQLLASLLSLLLVAGLAPLAMSATTDSPTPCCSGSNDCPIDKSTSCAYKVLTKEECERFCKAKTAAIAKDPSLAKPENKCKLCRAIVKADPSMRPICMKLRKNCRKMKKHCMNSSSDQSPAPVSAPQASSAPASSSSASDQPSTTASSSSATDSSIATQDASSSGAQQSSAPATSAN